MIGSHMIRTYVMRTCMALVSIAVVVPATGLGAPPRLDDYSLGVAIEVLGQRPIVQLTVPDSVYQSVVTDDLSDVRVFNADGVPVPHALCVAPTNAAPTISQQTLPVYRLQDVPGAATDGTRVEVQTPSGAQIRVQGADGTSPGQRQTSAYVIDARDVNDELRAMQFDWSSPDGASEVRVSVQASDDLDRWRTIVAGSTLLKVAAGEQQLRRHRIAIPQASYDYLRVERIDRGPPLQIDGVIAERVSPAAIIEPVWFSATPISAADANAVEFDAAHRAPVRFARLQPSQDNTSMHVAIESRAESDDAWQRQWTGEVYSILSETERRVSPPAEFAPTTHAHWRVRLTKQGESFYQPPLLELGYRPANLRFLAQGAGPFTLAYGSRRAEPVVERGCERLLGNLKEDELEQNIGEGYAGAIRRLGGPDALRALPKQTPLRQIVLWGALVLGVGALVAMALSLLRRVNTDGNPR